jgi:hypothetical protein
MARNLVRKLQYYGHQVTDFHEICCIVLRDAIGDVHVFQIFSKQLARLWLVDFVDLFDFVWYLTIQGIVCFWVVKVTVLNPWKKFPACYGTRRFITVFTTARHLSISWGRWPQSTTSHPTFKIHFNSTLPFPRTSSRWPLAFVFLHHNFAYISLTRTTVPSHLILLDLIAGNDVWRREQITKLLIINFPSTLLSFPYS